MSSEPPTLESTDKRYVEWYFWNAIIGPQYTRIQEHFENARDTAVPVALRIDAVRHMADAIRIYVVLVGYYLSNAPGGAGSGKLVSLPDGQETRVPWLQVLDATEAVFDQSLATAQDVAWAVPDLGGELVYSREMADEQAATGCHATARALLEVFDEVVRIASTQGLHGPRPVTPSEDPLKHAAVLAHILRLTTSGPPPATPDPDPVPTPPPAKVRFSKLLRPDKVQRPAAQA